jgi:hypothetical protein
MTELRNVRKFKLAAIDLDGTMLGADAAISPANRIAIKHLQGAGVQVVPASGRHFRSMLPYVEDLPGVEWMVSSQGGEVADRRRTVVLAAEFLPRAFVAESFQIGHSLGFSPVAFGTTGVFTDATWGPDLKFFSDLDGNRPREYRLPEILEHGIFKVIWIGSPEIVDRSLQSSPLNTAGLQVVRTDARFLEFMPVGTSKAAALDLLARRLGIQAAEVITFGDGDNDVSMFQWSGLSVAMPHGWPAAIQAASFTVAPGPAETALARGVDFLFAHGFLVPPGAPRHESPELARKDF